MSVALGAAFLTSLRGGRKELVLDGERAGDGAQRSQKEWKKTKELILAAFADFKTVSLIHVLMF